MRISDWSSDVCSSVLVAAGSRFPAVDVEARLMPNDDLRRIEAVLFAAERPLTRDEIALYMPEGSDIAGLLASLGDSYAGRGVELAERGGHWHFPPPPDMGHILRRKLAQSSKLKR